MKMIKTILRINGNLEVIDYIESKIKSIESNNEESFISNFFNEFDLSENWKYTNLGSKFVVLDEILLYNEFSLVSVDNEPEKFIKHLYKNLSYIDEGVEIEVTFVGSDYDVFGAMVLKESKISQKKLYGIEVPQSNEYVDPDEYDFRLQMLIDDIEEQKLEYLKICHIKHNEYEYEWI